MSDSVRPHRRQPTRLRRPWDSPGKNTGVGYHFFLQCMKVKSESEVAQSCLTLRDLMNYSPSGSSVHRILQARILKWVTIPFSKRSSWLRDQTWVSCIAGNAGIKLGSPVLQSCALESTFCDLILITAWQGCCCSVAQPCPTLCEPLEETRQTCLSFNISWSLLKLMSVILSNHLILCHSLLLLLSIFPSSRVFSKELFTLSGQSTGVSGSASILPMNIQGWFPLGLSNLILFQSKGISRVFSNTTVQKHQVFGAQFSL